MAGVDHASRHAGDRSEPGESAPISGEFREDDSLAATQSRQLVGIVPEEDVPQEVPFDAVGYSAA